MIAICTIDSLNNCFASKKKNAIKRIIIGKSGYFWLGYPKKFKQAIAFLFKRPNENNEQIKKTFFNRLESIYKVILAVWRSITYSL